MPEKQSMHWEPSPAELSARFREIAASVDGLTQRKMFGETAGFVNGNMVTGLHSGRWFVRLPEDQQAELMTLPGAGAFEPMAGRCAGTSSCRPTSSPTTRPSGPGSSGRSPSAAACRRKGDGRG